MAPLYDYRIGAGYNLPLGSLTNIETVADPNGRLLYPPQSYGSYLPGAPAYRLTGIEYERGFPSLTWSWAGNGGNGFMTYGGARVLRATFFGGLWSNTLTIYTKTTHESSYERYNAVGVLQKFPDSAPNFKVFTRFSIRFTRLVAL
jgi:hypothetical protein